ncbi:MAG: hypothetical protein L0H41_14835, partial [Microlunatus sp.]|nr:hypothetical protein [Microlunatus sp.]
MTTQRSIRRRSRFGATLAVTFLTTAAGFFTAASSSAASDPTFVVNSTGDAADARVDGVCATTAGMCTLRAAMT